MTNEEQSVFFWVGWAFFGAGLIGFRSMSFIIGTMCLAHAIGWL